MQGQDANRPQRIKIIIITIIIAIIVFIFGAWLITSAIKTVEKKQASQTTEVAKGNKKDEKPEAENNKTNETKPVDVNSNKSENQATSPAAQYNTNHQVIDQKTDMPNTGPEDLLPTAILIGLASFLFFKNREIKTKLLTRGLKA